MRRQLLVVLLCLANMACLAVERRVIQQKVYPAGFDNDSFLMFYYQGDTVYTIKGVPLFANLQIADLKLSPSNTSIATLQHNAYGDSYLYLYDLTPRHPIKDFTEKFFALSKRSPTAIAYSADARQIAVSYSNKQITIFDPQTIKVVKEYTSEVAPSKLAFSDNGYFLAAAKNDTLEIWNMERDTVRKRLKTEGTIRDFCFSDNSRNLIVLTEYGKMYVWDTGDFHLRYTIADLGRAIACAPDQTGKYVAVVVNDKLISVVNVLDPSERHMITDENGGISVARMIYHESKDKNYVLYNKRNAIVFEEVEGMTPYYNKMMSFELNSRLNQWTKQMPDETMEEYQLRVNETTRLEHARVIEQDIATQMATRMLGHSEVSIGDYNPVTNSLALKYGSMPDVFIEVPVSELDAFSSSSMLEFHNAKYALNPDDKFELVYAEVFNPDNGKTYVYDNQEYRTLSQMTMEANFVPLEIVQKSNMEETALMNIKEDIFNVAKQENVLSDKTHISVKTEAVNAVNADGERIVNYNVDFTYEVDEQFSARDDFKPGRYHVEESAAAKIMLRIMTEAFEKDFAKYMVDGKRVKIKVKGTADASPINHTLPYDGKYGEYDGEPVYLNNELSNITLNKKEGIATNEQLAFARALGVQHYIEKEISSIGNMKCDYEYHIEVSKEEGSKFRRISVQYTFIDAF